MMKMSKRGYFGIGIFHGNYCMNVATAGSIVMYDRALKRGLNNG